MPDGAGCQLVLACQVAHHPRPDDAGLIRAIEGALVAQRALPVPALGPFRARLAQKRLLRRALPRDDSVESGLALTRCDSCLSVIAVCVGSCGTFQACKYISASSLVSIRVFGAE